MTGDKAIIWKGALIAPLGGPLSMTLALTWDAAASEGLKGLHDLHFAVLFIFAFGLPISYGAMLVLGLPYLLWLRSKDRLTWIPVCAGAVLLGLVVWLAFLYSGLRPEALLHTVPFGALIGLAVGVLFCLTAKLRMR